MAKESEGSRDPKGNRRQRLAEQLRVNLQRRKAQTRSRRDGEADGRPAGLPAAPAGDEGDR